MSQITKRETWIDVLRAFACMCVLLVHSPAVYDGAIPGRFILAPSTYVLMAWGVNIFVMISGALLFSKEQEMIPFYKKRFGRILWPTFFWSIIYIFYDACLDGTFSLCYIIKKLLMIPFASQTGHLWFMYMLIAVYLVTPIISSWLCRANKREVQIVLLFWGFTLLLPYVQFLNEDCKAIVSTIGPLYHFYGFFGYALLGYYLKQYNTWKISNWKFIAISLFALLFPVLVFFTNILPISVLDGPNNIAKVALSSIAFIFIKSIKYKPSIALDVVNILAKYSFGIYLSHILFLKPLRMVLTQYHINYLIQMPLTAIVVGAISFLFVWMLSKVSFSKFIIG